MVDIRHVALPDRGLVAVAGADARKFLQGLISQDVAKVGAERAVYGALLTPQGKYLHDFFLLEIDATLYLDCEAARQDDLAGRLGRFKLRSKVALAVATDKFAVAAVIGPDAAARLELPEQAGAARAIGGGVAFVDPRWPGLGGRVVLPRETMAATLAGLGLAPAEGTIYERLRLEIGVADGSRDLEVEKSTLLESNFEALNGLDWDKGCYMGQELTARTKYRGLVKRRLWPVAIDGAAPPPGTPITAEGNDAGTMRTALGDVGLALLRLQALTGDAELSAGDARIAPRRPVWADDAGELVVGHNRTPSPTRTN